MADGSHRARPLAESRPLRWLTSGIVVGLVSCATLAAVSEIDPVGSADPPMAAAQGDPPATTTTTAPAHKGPFRVTVITPAPASAPVAPDVTVSVTLSAPVSPTSPVPTLTPAVPGTWVGFGTTQLEFQPMMSLVPGSTETLTVPGGATGMLATDGERLGATTTVPFTVAAGSTLRLQELLALLGYLPVSFTPTSPTPGLQFLAVPQTGTFSWRWPNQPAWLTSQWVPGTFGVITKGAVMAFETQHSLGTDGIAGTQVWAALLSAAADHDTDPATYDYVYVSTDSPETATVYQNGVPVYQTLANTGISSRPTDPGTYPVYLRFQVTTMSGTNPDGTHYTDPGIPWVSYFNGGDALHGYYRTSYGWPQSLGCVEMPPANAEVVWPYTPIGTLVTVE